MTTNPPSTMIVGTHVIFAPPRLEFSRAPLSDEITEAEELVSELETRAQEMMNALDRMNSSHPQIDIAEKKWAKVDRKAINARRRLYEIKQRLERGFSVNLNVPLPGTYRVFETNQEDGTVTLTHILGAEYPFWLTRNSWCVPITDVKVSQTPLCA